MSLVLPPWNLAGCFALSYPFVIPEAGPPLVYSEVNPNLAGRLATSPSLLPPCTIPEASSPLCLLTSKFQVGWLLCHLCVIPEASPPHVYSGVSPNVMPLPAWWCHFQLWHHNDITSCLIMLLLASENATSRLLTSLLRESQIDGHSQKGVPGWNAWEPLL